VDGRSSESANRGRIKRVTSIIHRWNFKKIIYRVKLRYGNKDKTSGHFLRPFSANKLVKKSVRVFTNWKFLLQRSCSLTDVFHAQQQRGTVKFSALSLQDGDSDCRRNPMCTTDLWRGAWRPSTSQVRCLRCTCIGPGLRVWCRGSGGSTLSVQVESRRTESHRQCDARRRSKVSKLRLTKRPNHLHAAMLIMLFM